MTGAGRTTADLIVSEGTCEDAIRVNLGTGTREPQCYLPEGHDDYHRGRYVTEKDDVGITWPGETK